MYRCHPKLNNRIHRHTHHYLMKLMIERLSVTTHHCCCFHCCLCCRGCSLLVPSTPKDAWRVPLGQSIFWIWYNQQDDGLPWEWQPEHISYGCCDKILHDILSCCGERQMQDAETGVWPNGGPKNNPKSQVQLKVSKIVWSWSIPTHETMYQPYLNHSICRTI